MSELLPVQCEDCWNGQDAIENGNCPFVAVDPHRYLLGFFTDLGRRSVSA